jgi:hypothetical protein
MRRRYVRPSVDADVWCSGDVGDHGACAFSNATYRRELLSSGKPLLRGAGECGNDKERAQHDENAHRGRATRRHLPSNRALSRLTHVMSGFPICAGRTKASTCAVARVYESLNHRWFDDCLRSPHSWMYAIDDKEAEEPDLLLVSARRYSGTQVIRTNS